MAASAVSKVFSGDEHVDTSIAEHILGCLEWRDLLKASAVCTHLNDIVTSSSRLQFELRLAFNDSAPHTKPEKHQSLGESLERLIDIQKRWAALAPKRVELLSGPNVGLPKVYGEAAHVSGGLLALPINSHPFDYDAPWCGWTVYDCTNARDTSLQQARQWTRRPGFKFAGFAMSRSENLVAVVRIPDERNYTTCQIYFYRLESTSGDGDVAPVQHPDAVPCGHLTAPIRGRVALGLTLTSETVCLQSWRRCDVWDWRSGRKILAELDDDPLVFSRWTRSLSEVEVMTGGGHNPNNTTNSAPEAQVHEINFVRAHMGDKEESRSLRFPVLRNQQYFARRQKGTVALPSRLILVGNDQISIPLRRMGPWSRSYDSYTVILRTKELRERLWADVTTIEVAHCGDIADFEFYEGGNTLAAVHGCRALTVEVSNPLSEGGDGVHIHTLRMADYRFKAASADMVHSSPLGSRFPSQPEKDTPGATSTGRYAMAPVIDWGHGTTPIETLVFKTADGSAWTSARMARPGVARQITIPGSSNFIDRVLIDDERAYISLVKYAHRDNAGGSISEESTNQGLLVLSF